MVGVHSRRSGNGRETSPEVRKWSGDPPEGLEVVGGPSQRSGSGWGTLPKVRKWLGDPPGGSEVVAEPTLRPGSGWGTHPEVRNCSGALLKIRGPSRRSRSGRGTLLEVWDPRRSGSGRGTYPQDRK